MLSIFLLVCIPVLGYLWPFVASHFPQTIELIIPLAFLLVNSSTAWIISYQIEEGIEGLWVYTWGNNPVLQ